MLIPLHNLSKVYAATMKAALKKSRLQRAGSFFIQLVILAFIFLIGNGIVWIINKMPHWILTAPFYILLFILFIFILAFIARAIAYMISIFE